MTTAGSSTPRTGRRPGSGSSRDDVLTAARRLFAAEGYASATIKQIAADAGVDGALVVRFFGSKDKLFAAAMEIPLAVAERMDEAFEGDPDALGERVVRAYLSLWDDLELSPPLLATFRSIASNEQAATQMRELLDARILSALAPRLDVHDAPTRIALAASQLFGVVIARQVLGVRSLTSADLDTLVTMLAPSIQTTLLHAATPRR